MQQGMAMARVLMSLVGMRSAVRTVVENKTAMRATVDEVQSALGQLRLCRVPAHEALTIYLEPKNAEEPQKRLNLIAEIVRGQPAHAQP